MDFLLYLSCYEFNLMSMIEKVNMYHPDKVADRIAGAVVDYCYTQQENPKVAVEVLLGHGLCTIIVESSVKVTTKAITPIVHRIAGDDVKLKLISVPQDAHLAGNQEGEVRCGDNGIFKGEPMTSEEIELSDIAHFICGLCPTDGKYIFDEKSGKLIVCQSCVDSDWLLDVLKTKYPHYNITVNPLGDWTGSIDVDSGATNRKLGSDQGRSVTGGGISGKDLSKSDVSVNIYAWLEAQRTGKSQNFFCAIGDAEVNGIPYSEIVKTAKEYIDSIGKMSERNSGLTNAFLMDNSLALHIVDVNTVIPFRNRYLYYSSCRIGIANDTIFYNRNIVFPCNSFNCLCHCIFTFCIYNW